MRLSTCKRCGEDTVLRQAQVQGQEQWLEYDDANRERLHKYSCKRSAWRGVQLERRVAR